jgi:hypothetical protein
MKNRPCGFPNHVTKTRTKAAEDRKKSNYAKRTWEVIENEGTRRKNEPGKTQKSLCFHPVFPTFRPHRTHHPTHLEGIWRNGESDINQSPEMRLSTTPHRTYLSPAFAGLKDFVRYDNVNGEKALRSFSAS